MIDIYSGVIFECAIPERDVNSIIKQVETEISTYLGTSIRVQLNKAYENKTDLGVEKGDFYLGFYTSELKESWKQENIEKAANMIKDMARCAVKVTVCYPFEVVAEIKQEE